MHPDPNRNQDYIKNTFLFLTLTMLLITAWNWLYPSHPAQKAATTQPTGLLQPNSTVSFPSEEDKDTVAKANASRVISVTTDNYIAKIDEATGDITELELRKPQSAGNQPSKMKLFQSERHYLAQSRLINANNQFLLPAIPFKATTTHYELTPNQKELTVILTKEGNGISLQKQITFKKGSYIIELGYSISNENSEPLRVTALYRLLHDGTAEPAKFLNKFYTGPVLYTQQHKFSKLAFTDIAQNKVSPPANTNTGWLGIIQHYFATVFLLNPKGAQAVCGQMPCQLFFDQRSSDHNYEVAFTTTLPTLAAHNTKSLTVSLFAGPQEYKTLAAIDEKLPLVKDYGIWHIFANPLFLTLQFIHGIVKNWGWAIILLVLLLKLILFPLSNASTKSMAKMRKLAPKMQALKERYADDKLKLQQETMELYKKEKINPLGGCLPMLVQFPIFLGLYWALFNSVELMGAPWIGWITDLSKPDPYYLLPVLMMITMFLQSFLNPPPADPTQAKMMKILPLLFSVMFFFFPSGLVLYWLVNGLLTLLQQWFINRSIAKQEDLVS
ncbi:MAG: membrane protein insertase YidC [Neisseriaceae bacterium]